MGLYPYLSDIPAGRYSGIVEITGIHAAY